MQTRPSAPAPAPATVAAAAGAAPRARFAYAAPRTYRFIDLVLARRRKGELAVETSASASASRHRLPDLPDEIWFAVKQFAAIELYLEEQDRFVLSFHGGSDDGLWDELEDPDGFDFIDCIGRVRLDFGHLGDCRMCDFLIFEHEGMVRTFNGNSQDIVAMLSDHGLKIACYHLVRDKTFDHDDVDTDLDGEALSHSSIAPR